MALNLLSYAARGQRGISLLIVLVALVLMSLAAVGVIRMVDTGTLIVGNLSFKQGTTSAADAGAEAGIAWLTSNVGGSTLFADIAGAGYYATSLDELDVTGKANVATRVLVDWNGDGCAYAASGSYARCISPTPKNDASNGNRTNYVITRMCKTTGDPNAAGNGCAKPMASANNRPTGRNEVKYGGGDISLSTAPYFRIVVRSEGPRNTVSFTETYVYF